MAMAADTLSRIEELAAFVATAEGGADVRVACRVQAAGRALPVYVMTLGCSRCDAPAVGVFGGVHGLERIGADVVLAALRSVLHRLRWDATLQQMLQGLRLVFMPLVNPGGLLRGTRANPQGVDLMRNAPVDCSGRALALVGGQRIGPSLPWYRGPAGVAMQPEAQALCDVVETELVPRPFSIAVDCHSGFGFADRVWFPHAHTTEPIEHLPELHALRELMDETLVHHRYVVEPQSRRYLAHGDLWDHLYLRARARTGSTFLPLTLEMGSWLWVKKNPRQLFRRDGMFNPGVPHREQRVMRRHLLLFDFLMRAAVSHARWRPADDTREAVRADALRRWYGVQAPR